MNSHSQKRPVHICFVAPFSYSLFVPSTHHPFGGIEVQAHLLATGLARRKDFRVSFVVWNHGQPSPQVVDGVTLYAYGREIFGLLDFERSPVIKAYGFILIMPGKIWDRINPAKAGDFKKNVERVLGKELTSNLGSIKRGIKSVFQFIFNNLVKISWKITLVLFEYYALMRVFTERWSKGGSSTKDKLSNTNAMIRIANFQRYDLYKLIDPDVFVGFGSSNLMAELIATSKIFSKKSIILIASDSNLSETYRKGSKQQNYYGCTADNCHYSLAKADLVVAQTRHQQLLARERFGLTCPIIPNPIDLGLQANSNRPREQRRYVAWIGKADGVKRPDLLLDLARHFPETEFRLIMNPSHPDVEEKVLADLPPNVIWSARLAHAEVPDFLEGAIAFVNTSVFEGFPNVFIESCRAGTPFLALAVDPDGVLEKFGCGASANGDFERLVAILDKAIRDEETWRRYHDAAIDYVWRHHDQGACCDLLGSAIGKVVALESSEPSKSKIGSA